LFPGELLPLVATVNHISVFNKIVQIHVLKKLCIKPTSAFSVAGCEVTGTKIGSVKELLSEFNIHNSGQKMQNEETPAKYFVKPAGPCSTFLKNIKTKRATDPHLSN
jgi:hypothetical protein